MVVVSMTLPNIGISSNIAYSKTRKVGYDLRDRRLHIAHEARARLVFECWTKQINKEVAFGGFRLCLRTTI